MDRRKKVSLEDLLQLKRAERPSADFWVHFDQELRSKQLAALMKTKPWWHSLASKRILVRICVPLSAAAALAISFGSFQGIASRRSTTAVAAAQPASKVDDASVEVASVTPVAATVASNVLPVSETVVRHDEVRTLEPSASTNAQVAAGQFLASGAATVKAAGQALAQLAGVSTGSNSLASADVPARTVEPLAQMVPPKDNRRSRLLAYSVAYDPHAPTSADSARTREHITHRISDEAIYDSISRLGVSGNSVSIKF